MVHLSTTPTMLGPRRYAYHVNRNAGALLNTSRDQNDDGDRPDMPFPMLQRTVLRFTFFPFIFLVILPELTRTTHL